MQRGKYIIVDGIEGAGKTTLLQRLAAELQSAQFPVQVIQQSDVPDLTIQAIQRLIDDSRYPVASRAEALLYNATHAQSLGTIRQIIETGVLCLTDYSPLSTLVAEYYGRGDIPDYVTATQIIKFATGNLQPDLHLVLDAPATVVHERLDTKRADTIDESYLERTRAGFLWEAKQRNLPVIYTTDDTDAVFAEVWKHITETLATRTKDSVHTPQSVGDIIAKKPSAAPSYQAPSTHTSTATSANANDAGTVKSALTPAPASTPRTHMADETIEVSNLLAGYVEQDQSLSCSEPDPLQIIFDIKDANGHYRYYVPDTVKGKVRSQYIRTMNQLFDNYASALLKLTVYIEASANTPKASQNAAWHSRMQKKARALLRPLLPAASTVPITTAAIASALASRLAALPLSEAIAISRQIQPDKTATLETVSSTSTQEITNLVRDLLPAGHTAESDHITLAACAPRNELDIIPSILYPFGDLPLRTLQAQVANWPYERRLDAIRSCLAAGTQSATALQTARYTFDVVGEYRTLRNLQRHHLLHDITWQPLSPRHGYSTPALIEAAGLADIYDDCFDISLQLYSALQSAGFPLEAQYATLLGHKVRWCATVDAATLFRHDLGAVSRSEHQLLQHMRDKAAETHPLIAELLGTNTASAANPVRSVPRHVSAN